MMSRQCSSDAHDSWEPHSSEHTSDSFGEVLKQMNLDKVASFAVQTRCEQTLTKCNAPNAAHHFGNARVSRTPLSGGYNILLPILFDDGVRWLLRLPKHGNRKDFDDDDARSFRSTVAIMKRLIRETTIPIPHIFASDAELETLGCPFMLMEYINGNTLYDMWFERTLSMSTQEEKRNAALHDIAAAVIQLSAYTFSQGGIPIFNRRGELDIMGPDRFDFFPKPDTPEEHEDNSMDDPNEVGPHSDTQTMFSALIEKARKRADMQGEKKHKLDLMRALLDVIPWPKNPEQQFVLHHPDFNSTNILVSDDGHVTAFIDWDGPLSASKMIGNLSYPSFLTRDWDPQMYGYDEGENDDASKSEGSPEDSAQTLAYYRKVYAKCMESQLVQRGRPASDVSITRLSLLVETLYTALTWDMSFARVLEKIVSEVLKTIDASEDLTWPSEGSDSDLYGDVGICETESAGPMPVLESERSQMSGSAIEDSIRPGESDTAVKDDCAQNQTADLFKVAATLADDPASAASFDVDSRYWPFLFDLEDGIDTRKRMQALKTGFARLWSLVAGGERY